MIHQKSLPRKQETQGYQRRHEAHEEEPDFEFEIDSLPYHAILFFLVVFVSSYLRVYSEFGEALMRSKASG
jgi:hypothetical protein